MTDRRSLIKAAAAAFASGLVPTRAVGAQESLDPVDLSVGTDQPRVVYAAVRSDLRVIDAREVSNVRWVQEDAGLRLTGDTSRFVFFSNDPMAFWVVGFYAIAKGMNMSKIVAGPYATVGHTTWKIDVDCGVTFNDFYLPDRLELR